MFGTHIGFEINMLNLANNMFIIDTIKSVLHFQ